MDEIKYTENHNIPIDTPTRIGVKTGNIEVNPRIFNKLTEAQKEITLRWCLFKHNKGEITDDFTADKRTAEYFLNQGVSIKTIFQGFVILYTLTPTLHNMTRIGKIVTFLNGFVSKKELDEIEPKDKPEKEQKH